MIGVNVYDSETEEVLASNIDLREAVQMVEDYTSSDPYQYLNISSRTGRYVYHVPDSDVTILLNPDDKERLLSELGPDAPVWDVSDGSLDDIEPLKMYMVIGNYEENEGWTLHRTWSYTGASVRSLPHDQYTYKSGFSVMSRSSDEVERLAVEAQRKSDELRDKHKQRETIRHILSKLSTQDRELLESYITDRETGELACDLIKCLQGY